MLLEKTWRWFGTNDTIGLSDLKQIGIEGIVTSLHHIKPGVVWHVDDILPVKKMIEHEGLRWSVVESLPVSDDIKLGTGNRDKHIENYKTSLINLAQCGVKTICYNFMPVLDWVRTDLHYRDNDGTETMLFDYHTFAAFDLFILKREDAAGDYPENIIRKANEIYQSMNDEEKEELAYNIIIVTQGFINSAVEDTNDYKEWFLRAIELYKELGTGKFRENLSFFLKEVVPVAETHGIRLCIHPDDPPFPLLGLPRIASTIEDFEQIFSYHDSPANGLTFCTGSLAAGKDNDLLQFIEKFADRIHFAHLRNLRFLNNHSFYESGHLDGDIDMYPIVKLLLREQYRRKNEGRDDIRIPFRPDHGKKMLDDFRRKSNPGYPLIGRMKGLSEIRGLETAIERILKDAD
ncbi:mannonate dehydratase [Proteiniphilum sp.]|uniref:mannonate dehydratase n=1 Tax=Proteiniphilum sp. TaxID=1926877 RepID=UPI00331B5BEF